VAHQLGTPNFPWRIDPTTCDKAFRLKPRSYDRVSQKGGILRGKERKKSGTIATAMQHEEAPMNRSTRNALVLSFLVVAPALLAANSTYPPPIPPTRPKGIYAVVNVTEYLNKYSQSYIISTLFPQLLANPAVSGIALYEEWWRVNPNPPADPASYDWTDATAYDWSFVDGAFAAASAYHTANPSKPLKMIQLVISPGFNSPSWVLNPISSCDFLFTGGTPPARVPVREGDLLRFQRRRRRRDRKSPGSADALGTHL
jgi:hypothetical protein